MKKLVTGLFIAILFFTGCNEKKEEKKQVVFSFIIPSPTNGQTLRYHDGIYIYSSKKENSIVSSIVINNPIACRREGVLAIAVENLTQKPITIKWNQIRLENPGQQIKLMPLEMMPDYFKRPDCAKPMINFKENDEILHRFLSKHYKESNGTILDTERELTVIYQKIRNDLTYYKMPNKNLLGAHKTTVGYLVVEFPKKPGNGCREFTLKIPVGNAVHTLHYILRSLD
ncbi:hypothetical protein [Hydrogenimonas cancrithermarum]|uniref:Lipoprotein n=1 Tax=Hydrogenimonas cancrithermarum TaxID=2993563 RepID=A0ABN6WX60_9BACT|nr:hypothetical protein [Hydrogenimonas cancrithermarum]BDY13737.1 hypothetical protein HCR_20490 [Hydrogenimonas cancrithermarum]